MQQIYNFVCLEPENAKQSTEEYAKNMAEGFDPEIMPNVKELLQYSYESLHSEMQTETQKTRLKNLKEALLGKEPWSVYILLSLVQP